MIRIDRLLCYLRLTKTRSIAQRLIAEGHIRRNCQRITNAAVKIEVGDILTVPLGNNVRVFELISIPERRGPATEACSHYRELEPQWLDQSGKSALAANQIETFEED